MRPTSRDSQGAGSISPSSGLTDSIAVLSKPSPGTISTSLRVLKTFSGHYFPFDMKISPCPTETIGNLQSGDIYWTVIHLRAIVHPGIIEWATPQSPRKEYPAAVAYHKSFRRRSRRLNESWQLHPRHPMNQDPFRVSAEAGHG